jgi:Domain of unknown function (DUF4157)
MGLQIGFQHRSPKHTSLARARTASSSARSRVPGYRLQQGIGNSAMTRLLRSGHIQAKLSVSNPGDAAEREADRVAGEVMRMPEPQPGLTVQRSAPRGAAQRKCGCDGTGGDCAECKEKNVSTLQRNASNHVEPKGVPSMVHDVLRSPGQSLDAQTRAFMEPRFNFDFSGVRVHTDDRAAQSARAVNASAYTLGPNIVFSAGQYDPQSAQGRRLVAHELTHVVQQHAGFDQIHRYSSITNGGEVRGVLQRSAIFTGRILDEGSCADLVAGSKWICCDPDNGFERKGKKKDIDGKDCPGEKFSPIFTCDNNCTKALANGCDDADNWMALPKSRFTNKKCGQDLVICANETFTHARVRDKSEREAWEVSKAIPAALGLSPDFKGAIYPDVNDAEFKKDKRCRQPPAPKATPPPTPTPAPKGSDKGSSKGE